MPYIFLHKEYEVLYSIEFCVALTECVYILDVFDKPDLVTYFVDKIMVNPQIEKLFHNASYHLRLLGKKQSENVICTYKII